MNRKQVDKMQSIIQKSEHIVFFGGAGVSTASGIPDFRSENGLYSRNVSAETILSKTFFENHPEEFFAFFRENMAFENVIPNSAHKKLAELEQHGKNVTIITQNIDNLHQRAGSKNVIELHGNACTGHCCNCSAAFQMMPEMQRNEVPTCECGGIIKPDIVLYEESLPEQAIKDARQALKNADTLIIAGTSMTVYPAKNLPKNHFRGKNLIILNHEQTFMDSYTNMVIRDNIADVFAEISAEYVDGLPDVPSTFRIPYQRPYSF